jgi:hypothetical protein
MKEAIKNERNKERKEGKKERMNEMKTSMYNHALQRTVDTAMQHHLHTAVDQSAVRVSVTYM